MPLDIKRTRAQAKIITRKFQSGHMASLSVFGDTIHLDLGKWVMIWGHERENHVRTREDQWKAKGRKITRTYIRLNLCKTEPTIPIKVERTCIKGVIRENIQKVSTIVVGTISTSLNDFLQNPKISLENILLIPSNLAASCQKQNMRGIKNPRIYL